MLAAQEIKNNSPILWMKEDFWASLLTEGSN
jgi:hypothetical protein